MSGYIVASVYGIVWLLSVVPLARVSLDWLASEDEDLGIGDTERFVALVIGVCMGSLWPITLTMWGAFRLMRGTTLLRSTQELEWERQAAERDKDIELERLRRQVREYKIKGGEML
jgi:hypothetical protein